MFVSGNNPIGGGQPNSIETSYVQMYRDGFEQAYQQSVSILDPYVERESQRGEFQYWDRIGEAEEMREDVTRYGDNPVSEIDHDRRRIDLRSYELGKYIDPKDLKRVASDPQNPYSQALLASGNRKRDDFIIERYFGPAYTGKGGESTINYCTAASDLDGTTITVGENSNGSSNPITATAGRYTLKAGAFEGVSVGSHFVITGSAAASGLTLAKLKALRTTMLRLEAINQDTVLNAFLSSAQFENLLGIDEIINSDYAVRKSLAEGQVTTYMGYRFILTERLPLVDDERRCIVSLPRAMKLAVGEDLKGDLWRDSSKKNIPYIHFKQMIGGSRMWGEIAGEIRCVE